MTTNCYQIDQQAKLTPVDYEKAVKLGSGHEERIWIDVQDAETSELGVLLEKLEVKNLAARLCMDARERPGFYPLNSFVFLVIPVDVDSETANLDEVEYVTLLCSQNLLLTIHNLKVNHLQSITTAHESADWLSNGSIAGLVSCILMILSLESMQRLSELRKSITVLEKRMDHTPQWVSMSEISVNRNRLLKLESVVNGQLPSFEMLLATDKPFFNSNPAREHLIGALLNLRAVDRSVHWLEGRLHVVRSVFEMRSNDKMNRRLGRLTILSAIFMPITFLAGVWGMNFDYMPALSLPYGYLIGVGSMILISTSMYIYFRRKGWFE